MKLGFIGFGEVAYELSCGFKSEGLSGIIAYDPMKDHEKYGELVRERAIKSSVDLMNTPDDVVKQADVIIAAAPGSYAMDVAKSALVELNANKIYADVSTSSPTTKRKIAEIICPTGARFVDGALMGGLTLQQHKVPTLISGDGADKFIEYMSPYHMSLKKVSNRPGDAIAIKLVRSVYTKGLASLEVEMLEAAVKLDVEGLVLDSVSKFSDSASFIDMMNFLVTAGAVHAERQSHEMDDSMKMLQELGICPIMTEATMKHLQYLASKKMKEKFQGKVPAQWESVLKELA